MVESQLLTSLGMVGIKNLGASTPIEIQNAGMKA